MEEIGVRLQFGESGSGFKLPLTLTTFSLPPRPPRKGPIQMALHPRLKCFLFLAAILLAFMGLPASAHSASVADTSWRGTDMFGTKMDFYFGADGMLIARDPQGIVTGTASWKQTDDLVEIEFNNGFVLLKGALAGDQLGGVGISRMGRSGP